MSINKIKVELYKIIMRLPGGKAFFRMRAQRRLNRIGDIADIFKHHFETNEWSNDESVSGPGSTLKYTKNIRNIIPQTVKELGVEKILDAPCGDYNWARMIGWISPVTYIGGDIVTPLIEKNQSLYGTESTKFVKLNIIEDKLPKADLWLCRDCLFHLSERDIFLTFYNFLKSDISYLLTSTHPECKKNRDIPTGSFREINLLIHPFNLGKPIRTIDDWIEGFPVRHLALWHRESIKNALASNNVFHQLVESVR
jgi:hypothetical protein